MVRGDFLSAIVNIVRSIFDFIDLLIEYLIAMGRDIVFVVSLLGSFVSHIPNYFSWLPSQLLAALVSILGIVCIYKLLGREG